MINDLLNQIKPREIKKQTTTTKRKKRKEKQQNNKPRNSA
jgi:hypothetical protein